jgi:hypothetical protein
MSSFAILAHRLVTEAAVNRSEFSEALDLALFELFGPSHRLASSSYSQISLCTWSWGAERIIDMVKRCITRVIRACRVSD